MAEKNENGRFLVTPHQLQLFFFPSNLRASKNGTVELEWGQLVAWLIFFELLPLWHRVAFSNCAIPLSL